jgi:hypothetical protein
VVNVSRRGAALTSALAGATRLAAMLVVRVANTRPEATQHAVVRQQQQQ